MKKFLGMALSLSMVFALTTSAFACQENEVCSFDEVAFAQAINLLSEDSQEENEVCNFDEVAFAQAVNSLSEDFQNEEGCSSTLISIDGNEQSIEIPEVPNIAPVSTSVPASFWNIASKGIYEGAFSNLRGTIYTNYYFDVNDGKYYSRVRCYGEYPSLSYQCGNYCVTCKKVLSTSSKYSTPSSVYVNSSWTSFCHSTGTAHEDHFVTPFVVNSSGLVNDQLYAIGGEIMVNYKNSWS